VEKLPSTARLINRVSSVCVAIVMFAVGWPYPSISVAATVIVVLLLIWFGGHGSDATLGMVTRGGVIDHPTPGWSFLIQSGNIEVREGPRRKKQHFSVSPE
jgi:hypothetical protein